MITKLTNEQESQIPIYLDKWLGHGFRTTAMDQEKARAAVDSIYTDLLGMPKPKLVFFLDSPMAVQLAINLLKNTKLDPGAQLGSQLDSQLYSQLDSQLGSQLYSQLGSQLGSTNLSYYGYTSAIWSYSYGAPYYGFYEYILDVLFPERTGDFQKFKGYLSAVKELHWTCLFPEIAFISDFPKEINRNAKHQLHADGKAALLYRDTCALYALNGIRVPKEIALTPGSELNAKEWIKHENVDYRREAFRKIGIDKVVTDLGAEVVDEFTCAVGGKYELLMLDIGLDSKRPFLRMQNPSIDVPHIEGVSPGIKTAKEALCFRNNLKKYAAPLALS